MCAALGGLLHKDAATTVEAEGAEDSLSILMPFLSSEDDDITPLDLYSRPPTQFGPGTGGVPPTYYSADLDATHATAVSEACIHDAIDALPVKPHHISLVQGPDLHLDRAPDDSDALDVQVTHQFRAHFGPSTGPVIDAAAQRNSSKATPAPPNSPNHPTIDEIIEDAMAGLSLADGSWGRRSRNDSASRSLSLPRGGSGDDISVSSFSRTPSYIPTDIKTDDTIDDIIHQIQRGSSRPLLLANATSLEAGDTSTAATPRQLGLWEVDPADVHIGSRLAVGGYSEVFIGKYQGTLVAVKLLSSSFQDPNAQERFAQEIAVMASLRHPNLVLFMGYATNPHLAMISEYMQRGSLFKVLRRGGNVPLEPKLQRTVAVSVARGMAYLHSRSPPLLHLDLKSPNILIDERWRVKIADFGLSRSKSLIYSYPSGDNNDNEGFGFEGTLEWMAPEVLRNEHIDERADVYSYGVVLWECLTGEAPWEGMHPMQVVAAVGFQGGTLPLPEHADPFLTNMCARCMAPAAQERPSFAEIMAELEEEYAPKSLRTMNRRLSESGSLSSDRENSWCSSEGGGGGGGGGGDAVLAGHTLQLPALNQLLFRQEGTPNAVDNIPSRTIDSNQSPFAKIAMNPVAAMEGGVAASQTPAVPGDNIASYVLKPTFDTPFAHMSPFSESYSASEDENDGEAEVAAAAQATNLAAAMQSAQL